MSIEGLFSLKGRTALVTGASRGLGREIAIGLAAAGARTVLGGRDRDALDVTLGMLDAPEKGRVEAFDVTDESSIADLIERLEKEGWTPDILINNAGMIDRAELEEIETRTFESVLRTNLTAAMMLTRALASGLRASENGRVVNVSSILGIVGRSNASSYVASKHALIGLSRALAAELGASGTTVNALCPGYTRTEINTVLQNDPEFDRFVTDRTALRRWGRAVDMVGPVVFLCSSAANYMTGQTLVVDGGMTGTL